MYSTIKTEEIKSKKIYFLFFYDHYLERINF